MQKGGVRSQIFGENAEFLAMPLTKPCHCNPYLLVIHKLVDVWLWSLSHNSHYATIRGMENLASRVKPHGLELVVGYFENSDQGWAEQEPFNAAVVNVQG